MPHGGKVHPIPTILHGANGVSWCDPRGINPIRASTSLIIEFLTSLFAEGKEYSTVNTNRSMLSVTHPPIDEISVGKHPLVCRFMQGLYNSRPPKPRYTFVWSVEQVLSHINTMPPSEEVPWSFRGNLQYLWH